VTSILFLVAALVLSLVGCAVLLLRHRKPTSLEYGIDAFSREMAALAPERQAATPRRWGAAALGRRRTAPRARRR
jgi:hypothetical protein